MKSEGRYSVFLVDDDRMTLLTLENCIKSELGKDHDISIRSFTDSQSMLVQMEAEQPHIVVLDYFLNAENPHSHNGLETLKKIKARSPDTFVIMLSAQKKEEVVYQIMTSGAFDFIMKNERAIASVITDVQQCIKNVEWIRSKRNVLWLEISGQPA